MWLGGMFIILAGFCVYYYEKIIALLYVSVSASVVSHLSSLFSSILMLYEAIKN